MTIFMETTKINADRTVGEIHAVLQKHGVSVVMNEIRGGVVSAVAFKYPLEGDEVPFRLPCRWEKVEALLKDEGRRPAYGDTYETWARRVAWRQILRWVEAQMALVQTNMVKLEEVFLPYRQCGPMGETVFEMIEKKGLPMLEGPRQ